MPSATEQLTKVEDQILDTLSNLQKPVLDAVKTIAEKVEGYVPEVPGSDNLSDIDELVLSQFAFIEKLVANQKDFALSVIETIKTVTAKPEAPKAKAKTTKPATAA
jgi:hypothetical protein